MHYYKVKWRTLHSLWNNRVVWFMESCLLLPTQSAFPMLITRMEGNTLPHLHCGKRDVSSMRDRRAQTTYRRGKYGSWCPVPAVEQRLLGCLDFWECSRKFGVCISQTHIQPFCSFPHYSVCHAPLDKKIFCFEEADKGRRDYLGTKWQKTVTDKCISTEAASDRERCCDGNIMNPDLIFADEKEWRVSYTYPS